MFKHYQLVVFDWEGTITENSLGYMVVAMAIAAERLHLPSFDLAYARQVITLGPAAAVKKLYPGASLHEQEDLFNETQKTTQDISSTVQLLPGVKQTIQWLHTEGMHLAIATNKSTQGLARVLRLSGIGDYIHVTRSATEAPPKPCPQMLEEIMSEFSLAAQETLMVGDSSSDMEMAATLGVDAIGMDFFQTDEQGLRAAGALAVFHDYEQLTQYIKDN